MLSIVSNKLPHTFLQLLHLSDDIFAETFLSDPEGLPQCECADPCIESQYSASVTHYKFPSKTGIKNQDVSTLGKLSIHCITYSLSEMSIPCIADR